MTAAELSFSTRPPPSAGKTYIFKDRFIGTEMFSVAQPYLIMPGNDAIYVVKSSLVTSGGGDVDIGRGNDFGGGDPDEAVEDTAGMVNNIVATYGLQEASMGKKDVMAWVKPYLARVKADLEKTNPARVEPFVAGASKFFQEEFAGKKFDDWVFYVNSAMDYEASLAFAKFPEGGTVPFFYFLRDGLVLCYPGSGESIAPENLVSAEVAAREGYVL